MIKQEERWTCHCRTGREQGDNGLSSLLHHGQVAWSWGAEYPIWGIDSSQALLEPTVLYGDLRPLQRHLELGWMQPTGWMLRREGGGNRCPPTTAMEGKDSAVWGETESSISAVLERNFIFSERLTDLFLGQMNLKSDKQCVDLWLGASENLVNIFCSSHRVSYAWPKVRKGMNTWEWQCLKSPSKLGQSLSVRADSCVRSGKFW